MYLKILLQGIAEKRRQLWQAAVMRSGLVTIVVLILLLSGLAFAWHEHTRGQFGKLRKTLAAKTSTPEEADPQPGGQDELRLKRSQLPGATGPEFLSATLLPGRGMNVLQITAYVPGKGEVSLLQSPTLDDAARQMTGTGEDSAGGESLKMGAAFEVPWAGKVSGTKSDDGQSVVAVWQGKNLSLPVTGSGKSAVGGLLLKQASSTRETNIMPDGGEARASFQAGDFDGHWLSQTELTSTVELNSTVIEMTVEARNTGSEPEPMGMGWHPRFAILGKRGQIVLHVPATEREEIADRATGLPSGRLLPVTGTAYDFAAKDGAPLGSMSLDDTFVHLKPGLMESGPMAEFIDPQSGYKLRLTALSSNIKAMRVVAPANEGYLTIDPMFHYDDPFGQEWPKQTDTGIEVLQPGQTVQWKIRLEIAPSTADAGDHF